MGYKIQAKPIVQIFKDGIESPLPVVPTTESKPVQQVTVPQNSPETVQEEEEDTFWTTTTIIAISVGGGIALLLLIGLIIFLVIRQRRKKSEMSTGKDHMPKADAGIPTADVTLRKAHLKSKDPCEIVIKSGFDTPTSPAQRTFFKENP